MKSLLKLTVVLLCASSVMAQDWAREQLESSPRHHEWLTVTHGERDVECFVAFPEVDRTAPAVVVIHENRGLTDWVRSLTDQLAEAGYIAIAPDLLSGMGPDGGKTSDFPDSDAARSAIYDLPAEQVTADLNAVVDEISDHSASNGTVTVAGFCWGGSQSFRFATNNDDIAAAFVFYGTAPDDDEAFARIDCPVYGFYGENDARVTSTVAATRERMAEAGKEYEPVIYGGAGHAFMRSGDAPGADEATKTARDDAWERWKTLLKETSGSTESAGSTTPTREPDVIFVPTPQAAVEKMLAMADIESGDLLYDLGCGDGRVVVTAAKKYGIEAVGVDIDPDRVKESRENVRENNVEDLVTIKHADIFEVDFSDADVVTLYLLPSLNRKLKPKLAKLEPGSRVISYDFDMYGAKPNQVYEHSGDDYSGTIYKWVVPWEKQDELDILDGD